MGTVEVVVLCFVLTVFVGLISHMITSDYCTSKYAKAEEKAKRISYENGYLDGEKYSLARASVREYSHGYDAGLKDAGEDGYNKGYNQGYDEGYTAANSKIANALHAILGDGTDSAFGTEKSCKNEKIAHDLKEAQKKIDKIDKIVLLSKCCKFPLRHN